MPSTMLLFASIVLAEHPNNSDIYRSPVILAATLFIVFPLRLIHNAVLKKPLKASSTQNGEEPLNFGCTPFLPFYSLTEAKPIDFWKTESYQYIILLVFPPMGFC